MTVLFKKLIFISIILLPCSLFAQMDSIGILKEQICYSLQSSSKKYGTYQGSEIKIDSVNNHRYTFLFSCEMDKILEVHDENSWKTFYILSSDENDKNSYTYNCVGTDSKRYIFILELESKTLSKIYDDTITKVEINMIDKLVEYKK